MNKSRTIVMAFAAGIIAWPWLMLTEEEKRSPDMSCPAVGEAWARVSDWSRWYHDLKNLLTEMFRCDAQWWSKFSAWLICAEALLLVLALSIIAVLLVRVANKGI